MDLQRLGPAKLERRRLTQIHRHADTHADTHRLAQMLPHGNTPLRQRCTHTLRSRH